MGFSSLGISGSMVLNYCFHPGHGLFVWLPGTLCSRAVVRWGSEHAVPRIARL